MAIATEISDNHHDSNNNISNGHTEIHSHENGKSKVKESNYDSEVLDGDSDYVKGRPTRVQEYYKWDIAWRNVGLMLVLHTGAVYGLYCYATYASLPSLIYTNFATMFFGMFLFILFIHICLQFIIFYL